MKKSRLGQNFLCDPSIAERIVDASGVGHEDSVIEIGPGRGIMTRIIAMRAKHLTAIELDKKLISTLREKLSDLENITLIQADVMDYDFGRHEAFKVIANIPYYITTPIIFKLIEEKNRLQSMTLTLQKEVAERIAAKPGNKQYGVLSLMVQFYGMTEILFTIPAEAFTPRPKVDSAVVTIDRHAFPPVQVEDRKLFDTIIKTSFAHRRKMLWNTLKKLDPDIKTVLLSLYIDPARRPETLSMEEFAAIANRLSRARA